MRMDKDIEFALSLIDDWQKELKGQIGEIKLTLEMAEQDNPTSEDDIYNKEQFISRKNRELENCHRTLEKLVLLKNKQDKNRIPAQPDDQIINTYQQYLESLADEDKRKVAGQEATLLKMAMEKAKKEFSQWFRYSDNTLDKPFLNCETIMMADNDE